MKYNVDWIERNLGITRRRLIGYEEKGLMPSNPRGHYREYDEEDVERLWKIKVLQQIGFSREEISYLEYDDKEKLNQRLDEIILKLAEMKKELQDNIRYAEFIKYSGEFPSRLENGKITEPEKLNPEKKICMSDEEIDKLVEELRLMGNNTYTKEDIRNIYGSCTYEKALNLIKTQHRHWMDLLWGLLGENDIESSEDIA